MQKNKWENTPVSKLNIVLALLSYYVLFKAFIPRFVYNLQLSNGIHANGTIIVQYQVLAYLLGLIPVIILLFPLLIKEFKFDFKKLLITIFTILIFGYILNVSLNSIISFINGGEYILSDNQNGLNILKSQNKYLFYLMVIVLAPLLEELIFRGCIFRSLRSYYGFIISSLISSILFGFIHISSSFMIHNWIDFIYLLLYSGLGVLFSCTYEYNKSIYICIFIHMIYNAWTVFI